MRRARSPRPYSATQRCVSVGPGQKALDQACGGWQQPWLLHDVRPLPIRIGSQSLLAFHFSPFSGVAAIREAGRKDRWFCGTTAERRAAYQCAPSIRYQPTKGDGQADERHTRTAKLLIEKCELSPLDENSFGESAVDLARMYGFNDLVALFEELVPGAALSEDDQVDWAAKHARDRERSPGNQLVDVDSIGHAGQEVAIMAVFDGDGDGVVVRDELAEAL